MVLNNFVIHKAVEQYTSTGVAGLVASLNDAGFVIIPASELTSLRAELGAQRLAHIEAINEKSSLLCATMDELSMIKRTAFQAQEMAKEICGYLDAARAELAAAVAENNRLQSVVEFEQRRYRVVKPDLDQARAELAKREALGLVKKTLPAPSKAVATSQLHNLHAAIDAVLKETGGENE
jgi:hypothetical protein